ncbi:unnamed protein product [Lota lota]
MNETDIGNTDKEIVRALKFKTLPFLSPEEGQETYRVVAEAVTLQQHCTEGFDDLATIDNQEELEWLQESKNGFDYDVDAMWIGLHDDLTRWQWSHGNQ